MRDIIQEIAVMGLCAIGATVFILAYFNCL